MMVPDESTRRFYASLTRQQLLEMRAAFTCDRAEALKLGIPTEFHDSRLALIAAVLRDRQNWAAGAP